MSFDQHRTDAFDRIPYLKGEPGRVRLDARSTMLTVNHEGDSKRDDAEPTLHSPNVESES